MRSVNSFLESFSSAIEKLESRLCLATTLNGIFLSPPVNSPVGSGAVIALGDFTSDGKVDLLAKNGSDGIVRLFAGKGDGSFETTGRPVPAGFGVSSLAVADFNKDGKLDVAAANNPGSTTVLSRVTILLGKGDGTFTVASTPFPGANPNDLVVADFDKDGLPDLAVANDLQWAPPGTAQPSSYGGGYLRGRGDGTFDTVRKIFLSGPQVHVAAGDVNGDGAADVAFAGPNVMSASPLPQATVYVAINANSGFIPGVVANFPGNAGGLTARDVNNDRRADIQVLQNFPRSNTGAYVVPGDATVRFYLSGPSPTDVNASSFSQGAIVPLPLTNAAGLSAADFDRDGRPDFAVAGQDARPTPTANIPGGAVAVIPGRPFTAANFLPIFRTGPSPISQAIGELNGDARPDILSGHATGVNALLNLSRPIATTISGEGGDLDPVEDPVALAEVI
jgi:hypothetical protein